MGESALDDIIKTEGITKQKKKKTRPDSVGFRFTKEQDVDGNMSI